MGNLRVIGIGEWQASRKSGDLLRTYGLGSCVALVLLHPQTMTVGLAHILLPDSVNQPTKVKKGPGYYADTAVPALLRMVLGMAGVTTPGGAGLVAKLAGGAVSWNTETRFQVGLRNIEAVERLLQHYRIPLVGRDTGGTASRTVTVDVATGAVVVRWAPGNNDVRL
jgi:chemotaxis protein CheD